MRHAECGCDPGAAVYCGPTSSADCRSVDRVGALLMRAYFAPVPPPRDSVLDWLGRTEWYEPVRPVSGTAEAPALTGDIGLLRNPTLQAAVTAYLDESRALAEAHQTPIGMYNPAADRLTGCVPLLWYCRTRSAETAALHDFLAV